MESQGKSKADEIAAIEAEISRLEERKRAISLTAKVKVEASDEKVVNAVTEVQVPPLAKQFPKYLIAGGTAGFVESCACHPLDTIKTRMQIQRKKMFNPFQVGRNIIKREGAFALYKGLTPVVSGIVPKMAIRFSSFETYKEWLGTNNPVTGEVNTFKTFIAGLASGITEAVMVVTPMEVLKIRLQSQRHSLVDPLETPRYRGFLHAAYVIVREEGPGALYKGVLPTVIRQGSNQAVNFTAYQEIKKNVLRIRETDALRPWETFLIGAVSGAMGPLANSPVDVIKTRLQRQRIVEGQAPKYNGVMGTISTMMKEEGFTSFYLGLTPRLMRIVPGQAITFMVYEFVSARLANLEK
mmetsp:Transcript_49715/g.124971  ORF Transcript_49715/g.124971 Transcript_49715/m.124971 type:complete len:354 (+) Transcript_49715:187-1248(+)|eukprot:CAMPEP_0177633064 /NCGR_PEP_ID=MMETSP0447-20121125/2634_1 /TAXON_ID=0 /ORGANISM="Stygamoeba regulata, Strain BSH-02190019" /LENGTH=353 /DNA_ID=CAMNT_0019134691 /DNA_START=124 /DNA_END=1185 /DNA_ORIENTATION=+